MGFNIQSASTTATQNDYTNFINSFVTNVVNNSSVTCNTNQTYNINFGSIPAGGGFPPQTCAFSFNNGNINVTQTSAQNCNLTAENINEISATITNNITNELSQWITNNLQSNQGWLAVALNSQFANNISAQQVAAMITNNAITNISSRCAAEISAAQSSNISICGVFNNTNFNLTQAAVITNLTSCINKNTINYIASNTQLNGMAQTADNKLASSQEGLSTIARYIIIAVVAVVILIIIGVILYFVFGGSKAPAPTNALDAKEREKRMLERELIEKRERQEGKPANSLASFTTRGNADESARQLFERHDELTSPTYIDRFRNLARRYGGYTDEI